MGPEDPYVWLEDLGSERTRRFVEEANRELEELVGARARELYPRVLELLRRPRVQQAVPLGEGYALLYRGERDSVVYVGRGGVRRVLYRASSDEVLPYIEKVRGAEVVAIHVSPAGADVGRTLIVDAEGTVLDSVEGSVWSFAYIGGVLHFVRFYRSGRAPDGVEAPVMRIVARRGGSEEVVWGSREVKRGMLLRLSYFPEAGVAAATISDGWSRSWIYTGDARDPSTWRLAVGGDAVYAPVGWADMLVVLRGAVEGDEVLGFDGRGVKKLFRAPRPVDAAYAKRGVVLLVLVEDARHRVVAYGVDGRRLWGYDPPEPSSVQGLEASDRGFLVTETGFLTPYRVVELGFDGSVRVVEDPGRWVDAEVREFWVRSFDGTRIHAFLTTGSGDVRGAVLYGYGGFGISLTPRFNPLLPLLLEMGLGFVQANLRGGREEGEAWHRAGMLRNKHRVFEDFASVAALIKGVGGRVVAWGSSNGGLLVAATAVRWPELIDVAIVGYPVLDMLRYHRLYVGRLWVPEYGDPEDPEMRSYLLSYSPYHNIPRAEERRLPPMLVYTGLHDDRVHPGHALKFVAKARDLGHRDVYLRVETRSGHSGATTEARAAELATILAFVEEVLGLREVG